MLKLNGTIAPTVAVADDRPAVKHLVREVLGKINTMPRKNTHSPNMMADMAEDSYRLCETGGVNRMLGDMRVRAHRRPMCSLLMGCARPMHGRSCSPHPHAV